MSFSFLKINGVFFDFLLQLLNLAQELFRHVPDGEQENPPPASANALVMAVTAFAQPGQPTFVSAPTHDEVQMMLGAVQSGRHVEGQNGAGPSTVQQRPGSTPGQLLVTPQQQDLMAQDQEQEQNLTSSRKRARGPLSAVIAERVEEMENELESAKKRVKDVEKENAELKMKLAAEAAAAKEQEQQLKRERDDAIKKEAAAKQALNEKQAEIEKLRSELDAKVKAGSAAIHHYSLIYKQLQDLKGESKNEQEKLEGELKEAQRKLEEAETELQQKREQLRSIRAVMGEERDGNNGADSSMGGQRQ